MTWDAWFAALTSSTVLGVLGFIGGAMLKGKIDSAFKSNVDQKIETLKAMLRKEEEAYKYDLRIRDEQIAALRSGALAGMASRQVLLEKKRIEAAERLWAAAVVQSKYRFVMKMAEKIKWSEALRVSVQKDAEGENVRKFGDMIWETGQIEKIVQTHAIDVDRIFISPQVWALFSASRHIVGHLIARLAAIRTGVGEDLIKEADDIIDLVKLAMPGYDKFLDDMGADGLYFLFDEIEEKLFIEIIKSLEHYNLDAKSLEAADGILKAAHKIGSQDISVRIPDSISKAK